MRRGLLLFCLALPVFAAGPELTARDVRNAAGIFGGPISPGEILKLFPTGAGPDNEAFAPLDADGRVGTLAGETRVLFDGVAAPIIYSVKGEVSAIVPYAVANKAAVEIVVEYRGERSAPVTLPVEASIPGIYTLDFSGKGQGAILNETGCCNSAANPAARGSIVVLYATGEGEINPPGVDGSISFYPKTSDYPAPKLPVRVTVGGVDTEIIYAAETPHCAKGLLQVNFRIPKEAPAGDRVALVLLVGDKRSQEGVTIAVRPAVQQILLIEAAPARRDHLRTLLEGAGYEVYAATGDRQAREIAETHPMDLAISDLGSLSDRRETLRRVRAQRPQLKIAVTTAAFGPRTLRTADQLGAEALLSEGMTPDQMLERVRDLLRSRPMPYERADVEPLAHHPAARP